MKKIVCLTTGVLLASTLTAHAATDGHVYLGLGVTSLALDDERVPGVYTRSPGHSSKLGSLILGYQFDDLWAADLTIGTDMSNNVDATQYSVNGYRFFGDKSWKPFISAGLSGVDVDQAVDDQTAQLQAGVGLSGALSENFELRLAYQHFFELGGESYNDDAVSLAINWHFRKPQAAPAPVAQPESVPPMKEVVDTIELLVEFDFDKSVIRSAYEPQFKDIATILNENSDIDMTVEGHTDWTGPEAYNDGLSLRRAEAVKDKFVTDYGIAAERITTQGFGESRPIADNSTREGRQKNRRAIAVILRPRMVSE
jgi:OOP family OmpA-OmpF porin